MEKVLYIWNDASVILFEGQDRYVGWLTLGICSTVEENESYSRPKRARSLVRALHFFLGTKKSMQQSLQAPGTVKSRANANAMGDGCRKTTIESKIITNFQGGRSEKASPI